MKRFILLAFILLGVGEYGFGQDVNSLFDPNQKQEVFAFATNKSQDGYITGGYMLGEWGVYIGLPYTEERIIYTQNGTISKDARFGIMKSLKPDKVILGMGAQPTSDGTKLNSFVGYNPLKSKEMKLWILGNVTGSVFTFGAGLSYRVK